MIKRKIKNFFFKVLPCCISFGILLCFCVQDNNFINLLNIFPKINIFYFSFSIISIFIYWAVDTLTIKEFLPKISNSIFDYFKITMYGQFYGAITPFSSGSQASQVIILKSKGIDPGKSISVLSQKFFISQCWTIIISLISMIFKSNKFQAQIPGFSFLTLVGFIIQCSGILAVILFFLNKKKVMLLINWGLSLAERIKLIKNSKKVSNDLENQLNFLIKNNFSINCGILVYVYCFIQNICYCMTSFFIAKSFGCHGFPVLDFIAAQTFVNLISIANPLPGSAGTAEGSFLLLYREFFDVKNISSAMILFRLINYYLGMIIGFIFVILSKFTDEKNKEANEK